MAATPVTMLSTGAKLRANQNGPDHRLQINQHLLYERDFYGDTFVSAHLQRLQNGVFTDNNIHKDDTLHVTFAAITFIFHPCNSDSHRFKSAVITIKARDYNEKSLRFLKYAPHVAYGRISSANLKWNFQLGASLGVTNGLVDANVKPSMGFQKDAVVGSFMKMQGSTRCAPITKESPVRKGDTMLVWSLEENSQQEGGIPSEFTFVFLLERPHPFPIQPELDDSRNRDKDNCSFSSGTTPEETKNALVTDGFQIQPRSAKLHLSTKLSSLSPASLVKPFNRTLSPKFGRVVFSTEDKLERVEDEGVRNRENPQEHRVCTFLLGHEHDGTKSSTALVTKSKVDLDILQVLPSDTLPSLGITPRSKDLGQDGVHEIASLLENDFISSLPLDVQGRIDPQPFSYAEDPTDSQPRHDDYNLIFTPIHISISVKPHISNAPDKATDIFAHEFEEAIIEGQVGQKFPTNLYDPVLTPHAAVKYQNVMVDGLFNFAQMPGNFEDMIELPGNAITTVEPAFSNGTK